MTIDQITDIVSSLVNQKYPNIHLSIETLNNFYGLGNIKLFRKFLGVPEEYKGGVPVTRLGIDVSRQNTEAIRKFKVLVEDATVASNGRYTLPANFVHLDSVRYSYFNGIDSKWKQVEELTEQEAGDRIDNPITGATKKHPVFWIMNTYLQLKPDDLSVVDVTYYRMPNRPIFATTVSNNVNTYDSVNSVQLEWDEKYHLDFINEVLYLISISIRDNQLYQYETNSKTTGQ